MGYQQCANLAPLCIVPIECHIRAQSGGGAKWLMTRFFPLFRAKLFTGKLGSHEISNIIPPCLKESLLIMFNKIKNEKFIPNFMNIANITTVPKKGSCLELTNERGIFRVSVIRNILMNLLYESKYSKIDKNISECQMGGRRNKGCKNNIFIINGIIHEVLRSKNNKPIVIQYYDYKQMFDSINLKEAINDIFDTGLKDEHLSILYKANEEIHMAVKTPRGLTERQKVKDIVLQGDKFSSLLASVQVDKIGQDCMKAGYHYMYKNILPIGFLGLVDDIAGITEAGVKANQLNALINVKTAEKSLQFGAKKCQYMIIGKNANLIKENLQVDNWKTEYRENEISGEINLNEYYGGKINILKTDQYKYLGFVISCKGDNMANIREVKGKALGVIRKILNKLQSLNLQQYYFECSLIFMNVMLRGTILYGADMYYGLKETELRQLERIEESFMRKIFNTTKGCPIINLYLEFGQIPARFEVMKMRLLFLKYILEQPKESNISKMLELQFEKPTYGDWANKCLSDIENINLKLTLDEIRAMSKQKYIRMLKEKIFQSALKYLLEKRGKKGKEISYTCIEMSEYLQPFNNHLTVKQKREMFAVRNKMIDIPANFSSKIESKCECGKKEDMQHIYECQKYNEKKQPSIQYEKIFHGNLTEQVLVYEKISENLEKRNQEQSLPFGQVDQLSCTGRDDK